MDPFIAQIVMFGGNFAPRGWALCDGQLLPIAQNTALFFIIGTTYGGDGETTFALPDLRGRVPMHPGNGPGLSPRQLGEKSGVESVTLNQTQIPSHTHTLSVTARCASSAGTSDPAAGKVWAGSSEGDQQYADAADSDMGTTAINASASNTGGSQPHTNLQPFQCVNFIIALQGIFPSQN